MSLATRRTLLLFCALGAGAAGASEGKWTPWQVLQLGPAWARSAGFSLPLSQLWDEKKKTGLLANAVLLPGCTGSFVSGTGLLITNHHCVAELLQQHSTPERNLFKEGWLARSPDDELRGKSFRVQVPRGFREVTKDVLDRVPPRADDLARFRAVEDRQKALLAECERQPNVRCQFAAFEGGTSFYLFEYQDLEDVRVVYAPPHALADFGGEVDNWSWPRHAGDFALVRVYGPDGKPWRPVHWFPLSTQGVKPGDAVAVLGYPGVSFRELLASEMTERSARWFPAIEAWTSELIAIYEKGRREDPLAEVALADDLQSLLNRYKNAQGQQAGFARGKLLDKQTRAEAAVVAYASSRPALAEALAARNALDAIARERLATWDRDFLLDLPGGLPKGLSWAVTIARRAAEAKKPDAEREPGFQDRDLRRLRDRLERDQKRLHLPTDMRVAEAWLARALALPEDQRIGAVTGLFLSGRRAGHVAEKVKALYGASMLLDADERLKMFDESLDKLRGRNDPLLELGFALDSERRSLKERRDAWAGAALRLRPAWRKAVLAQAGRPVAPDANGTLRVTFGRVAAYSPRDGMQMVPQTTLAGVLEKQTGEEPFAAPERVLEAARAGRVGRWKDPQLSDVPVDFLSDCDTSGGNSGSPVIDGQGRLVGVNFDRVWENVANDFGYNPSIARNISVDVRYLLWMLEEVEAAAPLLQELGVGPARGK